MIDPSPGGRTSPRPTPGLALAVRVGVGIAGAVDVAIAISAFAAASWLRDHPGLDEIDARRLADDWGPWMGALWIGLTAAYLVAGILWLVWQYRATKEVWDRGVPGLSIRPGWAVGWWLIPYANLVMPAVAMRQLRDASSGAPGSEAARRGSWIVWLWWALYLLGGVVALFIYLPTVLSKLRLIEPGVSMPPPVVQHLVTVVADAIGIQFLCHAASAVPAIVLVGQIQHRLERDLPTFVPPRPDYPAGARR